MSGLGLGAALTIGAGPAQAAGTAAQPAAHNASIAAGGHWGDDDSDVIGYFRTRIGCERVGRLGEYHGRWDDYDCTRVRFGFNRGAWALEVSTDDWNGGWDDDNWYGGWYDSWHGGDFNGGWDHDGWNHHHLNGSGNVAVFPLRSGPRSAI